MDLARLDDVQRQLDIVEAGDRIAQRPQIAGQPRRAAEARQQEVGGGAVAHGDGRLAQGPHRHAFGDMRPGGLVGRHQIALGEGDAAIEALLPALDAGEDQRDGERLERAAHGEAFVETVADEPPGGGIQHRDTQPPAAADLEILEPCLEISAVAREGQARYRERDHRHRGAARKHGHIARSPVPGSDRSLRRSA